VFSFRPTCLARGQGNDAKNRRSVAIISLERG
jgi:hypothetical protein